MSDFYKKINELSKAQGKVNTLMDELTRRVEKHLGEDWYVTYDRGDGILLGSPDASNYRIQTYVETQSMGREEAIEYIEARPFN